MGNNPPQFSGTDVVTALQPVRYLGKTGRSLIFDICMVVFGSIALFSMHVGGSSLGQHSRLQFSLHIESFHLCAFVSCVLGGKAWYFPDEF